MESEHYQELLNADLRVITFDRCHYENVCGIIMLLENMRTIDLSDDDFYVCVAWRYMKYGVSPDYHEMKRVDRISYRDDESFYLVCGKRTIVVRLHDRLGCCVSWLDMFRLYKFILYIGRATNGERLPEAEDDSIPLSNILCDTAARTALMEDLASLKQKALRRREK